MVFGKEVVSEAPWQHRLFLASRYIGLESSLGENAPDASSRNDDAWELFGPVDNTSYQCPEYKDYSEDGFCVPCPDDKPLWWLVLRWLKMMLLKIARSYHAKPFLLIIAPLVVGIMIGYWLGGTTQNQNCSQQTKRVGGRKRLSLLARSVSRVQDCATSFFFLLNGWLDAKRSPFTNANGVYLTSTKDHTTTNNQKVSLPNAGNGATGPIERNEESGLGKKEDSVRNNLRSDTGTMRESGVDVSRVPRHVAVIMDGNRRYGKAKYGNVSKGHWDGSSKLVEFSKWCIAEKVSVLTVYAFSTENWNRDPTEVASLMTIFAKYCDELRIEALQRNIKILVLSTDSSRIPSHVKEGLRRMVDETEHCTVLTLNICMSYGSRGEIVSASRSLAADAASGLLDVESIDENEFEKRLLTHHCGDPDVLIRTSGEVRISNFLLWQLAYTEMFFVDKPWPAVQKNDLLDVIRSYSEGRERRFGK